MAQDPSFTPQQVLNDARRRHPALHTGVITDVNLLDDYNHLLDELVALVMDLDDSLLTQYLAAITFTGADGGVLDLNAPAGTLLKILDADCTKYGVVTPVILGDVRHRYTLKADYADDARPVGYLVWNEPNNRWDLYEIGNWTGVTAIRLFAVLQPDRVTAGTLNTAHKLPEQLFRALVERVALLIGHRAGLNVQWTTEQNDRIVEATRAIGQRFARWGRLSRTAPPATAPIAETR